MYKIVCKVETAKGSYSVLNIQDLKSLALAHLYDEWYSTDNYINKNNQ